VIGIGQANLREELSDPGAERGAGLEPLVPLVVVVLHVGYPGRDHGKAETAPA